MGFAPFASLQCIVHPCCRGISDSATWMKQWRVWNLDRGSNTITSILHV